ncbi:MAG: hypothetical protein RJA55_973 [Acidobacteriota bacterium]
MTWSARAASPGDIPAIAQIYNEGYGRPRGRFDGVPTSSYRTRDRYQKHGKLDGVWRDAVIVERIIPENVR